MSHFRPEPGANYTTRYSHPDDLHERQLMTRVAGNDRRALQRLYEVYLPRLTRFFNHMTSTQDSHLIGYLVDETLIGVWLAREAVAGAPSVYVRIMQLAIGQARHYLHLPLPPSCPTPPPDWPSGDSTAASTSPLKMLGLLPLEQRVVAHFVYTGHSRQQVAEILEVPCGDVDTLLLEVRTRLRAVTSPRAVSPAAAVMVT
jgi:DNA-directed RNA polymerase specialized sigma24 family protein